MIPKLLKSLRQYKRDTILALVFIVGEVILEVLIPFITSPMVNSIEAGAQMNDILRSGVYIALAAIASLACGGLAGMEQFQMKKREHWTCWK